MNHLSSDETTLFEKYKYFDRVSVIQSISIFLLILGLLYLADRFTQVVSPQSQQHSIKNHYSIIEMEFVWANSFSNILDEGLFKNKYPVPKIQNRYNLLMKQVWDEYHTNLYVHLSSAYFPEDSSDVTGHGTRGNQPVIIVALPKLMDIYYDAEKRNKPEWKEGLQENLIINLLNEIESLVALKSE